MNQPLPVSQLERIIGVKFKNKDIVHEALTHRSAVRQSRSHGHNERLEFLGDAVLELVATEDLFQYSEKTEGELTSWRAALVNGEHLSKIAVELQLGEYLFMSKGEEASGGRKKDSTLATAVEALIGAIFLAQGYDKAKEFCGEYILVHLQKLLAEGKDKDQKSHFQEVAQKELNITPHYDVLSEEGPDHDKIFVCRAMIGDEAIAEGTGNSKQRAEQDAAKNALKTKGW